MTKVFKSIDQVKANGLFSLTKVIFPSRAIFISWAKKTLKVLCIFTKRHTELILWSGRLVNIRTIYSVSSNEKTKSKFSSRSLVVSISKRGTRPKAKMLEKNLLESSPRLRRGTDRARSRLSIRWFGIFVTKKFFCDFFATFCCFAIWHSNALSWFEGVKLRRL